MTIEVPILNRKDKSTVVGVQCRLLYTVLSSNYGKFRTVVKFIRFKDDGKRVLAEALAKRVAGLEATDDQVYASIVDPVMT